MNTFFYKNLFLILGASMVLSAGNISESRAAHAPGCFVENEYVYCYNAAGIQQKLGDWSGGSSSYKVASYETDGDKLIVTRKDGNVAEFTYDTSANTVTNNYISGYNKGTTNTYTFDSNGTKIYRTSYQASGDYNEIEAYDSNGNKTRYKQTQSDGSGYIETYGEDRKSVRITFDTDGNYTQRDEHLKNGQVTYTTRSCDSSGIDSSTGDCIKYTSGTDYTFDGIYSTDVHLPISELRCSSIDSAGVCTSYSRGEYRTYNENKDMTSFRICDSFNSAGECINYKSGNDYVYDENGKQTSYYETSCNGNTCTIKSYECNPKCSLASTSTVNVTEDQACTSDNSYCFGKNSSCSNHNNDGVCAACYAGYTLKNGQCHGCGMGVASCHWNNDDVVADSCSSNYIIGNGACHTCGSNVASCHWDGSGVVADSCNSGYAMGDGYCINCGSNVTSCHWDDGVVVDSCDSNYVIGNGSCHACGSNVETCHWDENTDKAVVDNCKNGYLMQDSSCVSSCDSDYFTKGQSCVKDCGEGYFSKDNTCVSDCGEGYLTKDNTCVTDCDTGYLIQDSACVTSCDSDYFTKGRSCVEDCGKGYVGNQASGNCAFIITDDMTKVAIESDDPESLEIVCYGDIEKCKQLAGSVAISNKLYYTSPHMDDLANRVIPATEDLCVGKYLWGDDSCNKMNEWECNASGEYYFDGTTCADRPEEGEIICNNPSYKAENGICWRKRYTPAEVAKVVGESNTILLYYK